MANDQSTSPNAPPANGGADVAAVWDRLPAHIRATITTLVQSAGVNSLPRATVSVDEAIGRWVEQLTGRGLSASTIATYVRQIRWVVRSQGWVTIEQLSAHGALVFLAAMQRTGHNGRPWSPSSCFSAINAMRSLGEFIRRDGLGPDPFAELEHPR